MNRMPLGTNFAGVRSVDNTNMIEIRPRFKLIRLTSMSKARLLQRK